MTAILLTPTVLSLLLLAAHFSRAGHLPLSILSLILLALVFVRRRWSAWTLQAVLVLGAAEWVRTTVVLVSARNAAGQPAGRLMMILGAVALLSLVAALLYRSQRLRRRYG